MENYPHDPVGTLEPMRMKDISDKSRFAVRQRFRIR